MEKNSGYEEQIKSPEWQKRRLEIMNFDGFRCQLCGCTDKTLHLHHFTYEKGCKIHEYGRIGLITLCEDCHNKEHGEYRKEFEYHLEVLKRKGYTWRELSLLLYSVIYATECDPQTPILKYFARMSGMYDDNKGLYMREETLDNLCERRNNAEWDDIKEYLEMKKSKEDNKNEHKLEF